MSRRSSPKKPRKPQQAKPKPAPSAAVPTPTPEPAAPPTIPPPKVKRGMVFVPPSRQESDDELFVLAQTMKVNHRKFADGILRGMSGNEAAAFSGYTGVHPRKQSSYLMRRPDVVRYIRLMQGRSYGESLVTLTLMADRLWAIITDPNASIRQKELSWGHLVKIRTAESRIPVLEKPAQSDTGPDPVAEVEKVMEDYLSRKDEETP